MNQVKKVKVMMLPTKNINKNGLQPFTFDKGNGLILPLTEAESRVYKDLDNTKANHLYFCIDEKIDEIEVCQILCKCGLATEVNEYWLNPKDDPEEDELRAWKDWEKLVSKFPPIMRVQEGDLIAVHTGNAIKIQKIKAINKENFLLQTSIGIVYIDAVLKWPWELEQKGEQQ